MLIVHWSHLPILLQASPVRVDLDTVVTEWLKMVSPIVEVVLVDESGTIRQPPCCSRKLESGTNCTFQSNGIPKLKKPVLLADGPLFPKVRRLRCTEHGGEFRYKQSFLSLVPPGWKLVPETTRIGHVRKLLSLSLAACMLIRAWHTCVQNGMLITVGFVARWLVSWINSRFVIAAVRREIVAAWNAALVDRAIIAGCLATVPAATSLSAILERLIPHENTLADLFRTVWHECLLDGVLTKDKVIAQIDGWDRISLAVATPIVLKPGGYGSIHTLLVCAGK
jgi:hypothetical protein